MTRHFLTLSDLSKDELKALINRAAELKAAHHRGEVSDVLKGRVLAMVFEKSSTRTRVSFEAGMTQMGGSAIFLSSRDTQLGRGEPIADAAKVISSMVDCVMIRTFGQDIVETFASHSTVPVINGLTDLLHPCQLLADMQTYFELRGDIAGKKVAWIGDGNNMCNSYIEAAIQFDFQLDVACPEGYEPDNHWVKEAGSRLRVLRSPLEAAAGASLVSTDVWASMGKEHEMTARTKVFAPYQVTRKIMAQALPDALFMHCLPAHRGEEVAAEVIDDPDVAVWPQAENRLHAQKALLEFLLVGSSS